MCRISIIDLQHDQTTKAVRDEQEWSVGHVLGSELASVLPQFECLDRAFLARLSAKSSR
jgi:hypothetical protein